MEGDLASFGQSSVWWLDLVLETIQRSFTSVVLSSGRETSTAQGLLLGSVPKSSSIHLQLQVSRPRFHLQGPWKPRAHEPVL